MQHLFCFGLGYTANFLIKELDNSWRVSGTNREEFHQLKELSNDITHILISIPPQGEYDIVLEKFKQQIINLPNLKWIGYLSSTGVYGDHQGNIVDEITRSIEKHPRIFAEQEWLKLSQTHVFRLAGIYGPGRNELARVIKGEARIINKEGHVFNRIHVEDIAQILFASMQSPTEGEIYNLADNLPAAQKDVVIYACNLLNMPLPKEEEFATASMSEMLRYYYNKCIRVSNQKVKSNLKIELRFPTYKEGLLQLARQRDLSCP